MYCVSFILSLLSVQWMQLKTRKQDMRRLFERMRDYQYEKVREEPDKALTEDTRVLTDEDMMRWVWSVGTAAGYK